MIKKWMTVAKKELINLKILTVQAVERESPKNGQRHEFYLFDSPDWINVVTVTTEEKLVMIRQYRHGNDEITLEVPGGMVDPGEEPVTAATRELQEETGYQSAPLVEIGVVSPNPALFNNKTYTFLAKEAKMTGSQMLDGTEIIEVVELSFAEVKGLIRSGGITHSLTINAIYWYEQHLAAQAG